jgi:Ca2+-binding EF-hand superfamily protein
MKTYLLGGAAVAAILVASAAFAQTAEPVQPARHPHVAKPMTRADVQGHVARMFARIDANHDGFVTKAEADAHHAQPEGKMAQRSEQRAQHSDPAKYFNRLDANHDGQITRAEAEAARSARLAKKGRQPSQAHAGASGHLFERADLNKDGVITRAEFDAAPRASHAGMRQAGMRRGFGGRMFDMADVNKDGRVSLAEAQQVALQHFDRADLNHDGIVSPEEREQAHQLMRSQHHPS